MTTERIIITGFMGSGKSTVARALALLLAAEMIDLDEAITREALRSPGEIIESDGEAAFREIETRALAGVLASERNEVIALGGGAWTLPRNRDLIKSKGALSVWLDAPFDLCWSRIQNSEAHRPLARTEASARALYDHRREQYRLADLSISADKNKTHDQIGAEIFALIKQARARRPA